MSLTTRILLLVLLALAPALVIQGYNEVALRASRDEAVRADTMATARNVAEDVRQVADGVHQALNLVAQDPSVRALDPAGCAQYLHRAAAQMPHILLLALSRPDGSVLCDNLGSTPGAYENGGRTYHRRAVAEGTFVMGRYASGLVPGRDSLQFAQPLRDGAGGILGVLVAAIDLDWFGRHLQQGVRLPSTSLTVIDADDTILVRRPDSADWVGRTVPPGRVKILAARGEAVRDDVGLDGVMRVLANARTGGLAAGAWVTVGRDREAAFADVDAATRRGLVLIGLGTLLALAAALAAGRLFIRRPFGRLLRTAAAWQAGDMSARTGLSGGDEFGRLGRKLDAMAGTLQRNEAALRDEVAHGRAMQERQVTMLHELNHRVKNTLATVQALARQSARAEAGQGQGAGGRSADGQLEARILSLSKTHDLLTRDDWSGAPLREVLESELSPYRAGDDHVVLEGPEVSLPPRYVLALGMTVHELTTNAAKYGALSVAGGRVHVAWSVETVESGARRLRLAWRESGGPAVSAPIRSGFGTRLIAGGIRRELDGAVDLTFAAEGLRCRLDVPLEAATPAMLAPTR